MSFKDRMMAQTLFEGQELSTNIKYNENVDFIVFYGSYDKGYNNNYVHKQFFI